MNRIKALLLRERTIIFLICLAMLSGICYYTMIYFDVLKSVDPKEYYRMAQFDLDQHPIRRYRILVPFLAAGINQVILFLKDFVSPDSLRGLFPLKFSFYLVNVVFMSFWCMFIYVLCRSHSASRPAALAGMMMVLTSKWTIYIAAIPLVESLHCLVLIIALLGIRQKKTGYIYLAILLGPFTKESFLFVAPVIFFFSHVPKSRQLLLFAVSGILVFALRYALDSITGNNVSESLHTDLNFFPEIPEKLRSLVTLASLNETFATFGLWLLLPFAGALLIKQYFRFILSRHEPYLRAYLASVVFMAIINGDLSRMLYLGMPVAALVVAWTADRIREIYLKYPAQG